MRRYSIAVAGCGPAGLATALLLQRHGHRVQLFERFGKPSPVGSGLMLQPTGMAVLEMLGLAAATRAAGSPIHRLQGRSATTGRLVLDVHYHWLGANAPHAVGIHRSVLFDLLFQAVGSAGVTIKAGHEIRSSRLGRDGRQLEFADGNWSPPFDLVVDATGTRSPLAEPCGGLLAYGALWATVDWPCETVFDGQALDQRYRQASIMAGLMPTGRLASGRRVGTFFWSLRGDSFSAWEKAGLDPWKRQVFEIWPGIATVLDQISTADHLTFAQYSHRTLPSPAGPRIFHVGDAWHSTSPQLGQGANMALLDAYALTMALAREAELPDALARAARLRQWHVRLYQALSFALTPFYQSDSSLLPAIRDLLVPHVARIWPSTWIQAAMVSGLLGNPLGRLGLKGSGL